MTITPLFPPHPHWLGNSHGCPPFDVLNSILYKVAADNPSSSDIQQIIGKLMIIGRTYSASVERRQTRNTDDHRQALEVIVTAAQAVAASQCEPLIAQVGVNDKLTVDRLPQAVAIHAELCRALGMV